MKHLKVFITKQFENVSEISSSLATGLNARARVCVFVCARLSTPNSSGEGYNECFVIRALKIKRETVTFH